MKIQIKKRVLLLPLLGLFCSFDTPDPKLFEISKNMEILASVYSEVNKYYVDEVDPSKMMRIGVDAMLASLDPYTNYIPEDDIEDFRFMSTGQYGGIGAMIGNKGGNVTVILPYKGFPAYKSGLKIGDVLLQIGDQNVAGKGNMDVGKLLKGQAGTQVTLKVKRYGVEKPFEVVITREKITVENVPYHGMITNDIGYLVLTTFTQEAANNVKKAILDLQAKGAKKIIFDLRDNGGGLLDEAINICGLFVPKGKEVVSTKGKVQKWNETFRTAYAPIAPDLPLVLLTNGHSASASEIVSGVMQDYDRGVLIGKRTYGKGLVQATFSTAYNSKVKVTTAKYYIPSGRCIQAIDYGKKDENGVSKKIPDSLLVAFKTLNGRKVWDGAGLDPDVKTSEEDVPMILQALVSKNLIFDYATYYFYNKPEVKDALSFGISNAEYEEFKNWLKGKEYSYEIPLEKKVKELKEQCVKGSVESESEFSSILKKIDKMKSDDLEEFQKQIVFELEKEILTRYFYDEGGYLHSFRHDSDVLEAVKVLNDLNLYHKILGK